MAGDQLRPAVLAFETVAPRFDSRFGEWRSVAAQRRAVRRALVSAFPEGAHVLELGGGTAEDAVWLMQQGRSVHLTDAAPTMVDIARSKLTALGGRADVAAAEDFEAFAERHLAAGGALFDGVFSNFAPLNCVEDLTPVARALARLVKPGGAVLLVVFGAASPGDMLVELLRGRRDQVFRRFRRGQVPARLGGQHFTVTYHRGRALIDAMSPWFRPAGKLGIGVFVPPSAAEPWISGHPRLLALMEALDRLVERPLAVLGDHILYRFERRP